MPLRPPLTCNFSRVAKSSGSTHPQETAGRPRGHDESGGPVSVPLVAAPVPPAIPARHRRRRGPDRLPRLSAVGSWPLPPAAPIPALRSPDRRPSARWPAVRGSGTSRRIAPGRCWCAVGRALRSSGTALPSNSASLSGSGRTPRPAVQRTRGAGLPWQSALGSGGGPPWRPAPSCWPGPQPPGVPNRRPAARPATGARLPPALCPGSPGAVSVPSAAPFSRDPI